MSKHNVHAIDHNDNKILCQSMILITCLMFFNLPMLTTIAWAPLILACSLFIKKTHMMILYWLHPSMKMMVLRVPATLVSRYLHYLLDFRKIPLLFMIMTSSIWFFSTNHPQLQHDFNDEDSLAFSETYISAADSFFSNRWKHS